MQEINLLQKESGSSKEFTLNFRRGGNLTFYVFLALLVLEVGAYLWLGFSQRQVSGQMTTLEQRAATIDLEISKVSEARGAALSAQVRLKNFEILLASHLFWSKVFTELENVTYKPIHFESLQVDQVNHRFMLKGFTPSQTDLAKLMAGLQTSPSIQDVNLRSMSAQTGEESGYSFSMDATFDPKLLKR